MAEKKAKRPAHRPTDYDAKYNNIAYKYSLLGKTDVQLADLLSVSERTINTWKKKHPEFLQSIKKGKELADGDVVDSLYKRATGYSHDEDKILSTQEGVQIIPTTKHYAPDPTSMIFWLKNRQPELWREKSLKEITGKDGGPMESKVAVVDFTDMDPQEASNKYQDMMG